MKLDGIKKIFKLNSVQWSMIMYFAGLILISNIVIPMSVVAQTSTVVHKVLWALTLSVFATGYIMSFVAFCRRHLSIPQTMLFLLSLIFFILFIFIYFKLDSRSISFGESPFDFAVGVIFVCYAFLPVVLTMADVVVTKLKAKKE